MARFRHAPLPLESGLQMAGERVSRFLLGEPIYPAVNLSGCAPDLAGLADVAELAIPRMLVHRLEAEWANPLVRVGKVSAAGFIYLALLHHPALRHELVFPGGEILDEE